MYILKLIDGDPRYIVRGLANESERVKQLKRGLLRTTKRGHSKNNQKKLKQAKTT